MPFWESRRAAQFAAETAKKILRALAITESPKNVSQLTKAAGIKGGFLIVPLKFLYDQGLIASESGKWSRLAAAADTDSYFITEKGRQQM